MNPAIPILLQFYSSIALTIGHLGQPAAFNFAVFVAWVQVLATLPMLLKSPRELFSHGRLPRLPLVRALFLLNVLLLSLSGWAWTALTWLGCWLLLNRKRHQFEKQCRLATEEEIKEV